MIAGRDCNSRQARDRVPLSVGPPAVCPSNEYVKAASVIASTALVIAFFGLNTCLSYTASLDRFIGIREAFAADLVALAIPLSPELQQNLVNRKRTHQISGSGIDYVDEDAQLDYEALKATLPPVDRITPRPLWLEKAEIQSVIDHNGGFLSSYRRGIMFEITVKEADRPHSWSAFPTLSFPDDLMPNHTLKAAAECAGQLDDATTYDKIYRACEKTVLDRGVKFPLIDVEFPIQYIILVTFIAICGCIIILSDLSRPFWICLPPPRSSRGLCSMPPRAPESYLPMPGPLASASLPGCSSASPSRSPPCVSAWTARSATWGPTPW